MTRATVPARISSHTHKLLTTMAKESGASMAFLIDIAVSQMHKNGIEKDAIISVMQSSIDAAVAKLCSAQGPYPYLQGGKEEEDSDLVELDAIIKSQVEKYRSKTVSPVEDEDEDEDSTIEDLGDL